LVNNAGIGGPNAGVEETSTQQWDAVLGVNLRGPFFATRAVSRHMIDAGWGRVVNMSSISAVGDSGRVDYASAKAGLIGFTKSLARSGPGPDPAGDQLFDDGGAVAGQFLRGVEFVGPVAGEQHGQLAQRSGIHQASPYVAVRGGPR
jgi:hypothetical protein